MRHRHRGCHSDPNPNPHCLGDHRCRRRCRSYRHRRRRRRYLHFVKFGIGNLAVSLCVDLESVLVESTDYDTLRDLEVKHISFRFM